MATIKVFFSSSSGNDREGRVGYQVIHAKSRSIIWTGFYIKSSEWNPERQCVKITVENRADERLTEIRRAIRFDVSRLKRIIRKLEDSELPFDSEDVVYEYYRFMAEGNIISFTENLVGEMRLNGRMRTSETYQSALSSFRKFLASRPSFMNGGIADNIMMDALTASDMEAYESWLRECGLVRNSISFYMRILRAVYNRGIDRGFTEDHMPFRHVYTGVEKTVKRALPIGIISKIKSLELQNRGYLDFARDMFMLSFYLQRDEFCRHVLSPKE